MWIEIAAPQFERIDHKEIFVDMDPLWLGIGPAEPKGKKQEYCQCGIPITLLYYDEMS